MRKIFTSLMLCQLLIPMTASADTAQKIMSWTVDPDGTGYTEVSLGSSNVSGQMVTVDWGDGVESAQVRVPYHNNENAFVTLRERPRGTTITVYGDPTTIYEVDGSFSTGNVKTKTVDVSALTNVYRMDFSSNDLTTIDLTNNKELWKFGANSCNLTTVKLDNPKLERLELDNTLTSGNNHVTRLDFTKTPALKVFKANYNLITEIDFSSLKNLEQIYMVGNELTTLDLTGLDKLNYITVNANKLTTLDASMMVNTSYTRIFAMNNGLTSIKVPDAIGACNVNGNKLTFATLPVISGTLTYNTQDPMAATFADGKVDLSSQLTIDGKTTAYTWKTGDAVLTEGVDYEAKDGVFTFLDNFNGVVCSMTNETFPKLTLTTEPLAVFSSGIEVVSAAGVSVKAIAGAIVIEGDFTAATITDMAGHTVAAEAVTPMTPGLYIVTVDGISHKVAVK
ncbi:MAG: hypothetical protein NC117_01945 [Pseudoflavonifractor sp.]|nr:hypothetical protein [Pseudoflavonifractor sp.]